MENKISVIIPARNEEDNIERLLKSIRDNTLEKEKYEIIVVDGGSTDNTRKICRKYDARIVEGPAKGPAVARNEGWKNAEGNLFFFLDADWYISKDTLEKIHTFFKENSDIEMAGIHGEHKPKTAIAQAISAENRFGRDSHRLPIFKPIKETLEKLKSKV